MSERENPFTLMYGKTALSVVKRTEVAEGVLSKFLSKDPQILAYLITGIRGSGKTVFMRSLADELSKQGWIVVDLNPQGDLMTSFSQRLYAQGQLQKLFADWSLTVSVPYMSLTVKKGQVITEPDIIAEELLKKAKEKGKRVLVTIDEANATKELRYFANFYQSAIGRGYKLFLLMTGLKENIERITADKGMSFLSRTPKIELGPLDALAIASQYQKEFAVSEERAVELAKITKGYAFAYQVLGYFLYESGGTEVDEALLSKYQEYLWHNGYDILWKDLTPKEKLFCQALAETDGAAKDVMAKAGMKESNFQNYRKRLIDKGFIVSKEYGTLSFALPCFAPFASMMGHLEAE